MQNDSTDWKHDKYDRESFSDETLPMVYLAHPGIGHLRMLSVEEPVKARRDGGRKHALVQYAPRLYEASWYSIGVHVITFNTSCGHI